jgi:hypothetical protein
MEMLARRLAPGGRLLLWVGGETPPVPDGFANRADVALAGSERRRLLVLERADQRRS